MKQNNRFNKFNRNNAVKEKKMACVCGNMAKLHLNKNYPFGKKSKAVISEFYRCEECGKTTFVNRNAIGGKNGSR